MNKQISRRSFLIGFASAVVITALPTTMLAESRWNRHKKQKAESESSTGSTGSASSTDTPAEQRRNSATAVPPATTPTPRWNGDGNVIRRWHRIRIAFAR